MSRGTVVHRDYVIELEDGRTIKESIDSSFWDGQPVGTWLSRALDEMMWYETIPNGYIKTKIRKVTSVVRDG